MRAKGYVTVKWFLKFLKTAVLVHEKDTRN